MSLILLFLLWQIPSNAATVLLSWNAPATNEDGTPLTDLSGYRAYIGQASRTYPQMLDVGQAISMSQSDYVVGQTYYFAVTAYDRSGNESVYSEEVSLTIPSTQPGDTTTPVVAITSPANGSTVPRKGKVIITAAASDNVGVNRVEFYVNGRLQCSTGTAPYRCAWTVPAAGGSRRYQLQANVLDQEGNVGSSLVVEVIAQ